MSSKTKGNELCIDNRPTRTTSLFKIKARLRINTTSQLRDLIITDDGACEQHAPPLITSAPKPEVKPLHLVFLVDTSDSFNKLDEGDSSAGEIILEKFVMEFLEKGKFSDREQPTTVTVVQFSGMGPDTNYEPGTGGIAVKGANLRHYKLELGPKNFGKLSEEERTEELQKLKDITTIDGNGQLYLALQDISMSNFLSKLNHEAGVDRDTKSTKYLIIVTDDEWDFTDLKLCDELKNDNQIIVTNDGDKMDASKKKLAIVKFTKSKYDEIHTCIVKDKEQPPPANPPPANPDKKPFLKRELRRGTTRDIALTELMGILGQNTHQLTRSAVSESKFGGPATLMHMALSNLKKSLKENHQLEFE